MRILWFNTDKDSQDPLTLLHDTDPAPPSKELQFPPEIVQKIVDYLPRTSLPSVAGVSQIWYATVMPVLYRHLYICTLPHWLLLTRTMSNPDFAFKHFVSSLVLKPSPKLISAQLTSYLNQTVVPNDDTLQPGTRGYVRLERVNYNLTGLENIETPMRDEDNGEENQQHENYREMDDTKKEYEWLTLVTTEQVVSVIGGCPALEYLHLSGCQNLYDNVLTNLMECKLSNLSVSKPMKGIWTSLLRNLTFRGFESLIKFEKAHFKERQLKHLDIGYNISLSEKAIEQIVECWGSTLTHLRLDTIYEVSNNTINAIAKYCPNLILLHLTRCWNISNAGLLALSSRCKQLKYVSLAFLSQVNEDGIRHLVQLPSIVWLDITGCGINNLFKQMILEAYKTYRRQNNLQPVYFQDGRVNLI